MTAFLTLFLVFVTSFGLSVMVESAIKREDASEGDQAVLPAETPKPEPVLPKWVEYDPILADLLDPVMVDGEVYWHPLEACPVGLVTAALGPPGEEDEVDPELPEMEEAPAPVISDHNWWKEAAATHSTTKIKFLDRVAPVSRSRRRESKASKNAMKRAHERHRRRQRESKWIRAANFSTSIPSDRFTNRSCPRCDSWFIPTDKDMVFCSRKCIEAYPSYVAEMAKEYACRSCRAEVTSSWDEGLRQACTDKPTHDVLDYGSFDMAAIQRHVEAREVFRMIMEDLDDLERDPVAFRDVALAGLTHREKVTVLDRLRDAANGNDLELLVMSAGGEPVVASFREGSTQEDVQPWPELKGGYWVIWLNKQGEGHTHHWEIWTDKSMTGNPLATGWSDTLSAAEHIVADLTGQGVGLLSRPGAPCRCDESDPRMGTTKDPWVWSETRDDKTGEVVMECWESTDPDSPYWTILRLERQSTYHWWVCDGPNHTDTPTYNGTESTWGSARKAIEFAQRKVRDDIVDAFFVDLDELEPEDSWDRAVRLAEEVSREDEFGLPVMEYDEARVDEDHPACYPLTPEDGVWGHDEIPTARHPARRRAAPLARESRLTVGPYNPKGHAGMTFRPSRPSKPENVRTTRPPQRLMPPGLSDPGEREGGPTQKRLDRTKYVPEEGVEYGPISIVWASAYLLFTGASWVPYEHRCYCHDCNGGYKNPKPHLGMVRRWR